MIVVIVVINLCQLDMGTYEVAFFRFRAINAPK